MNADDVIIKWGLITIRFHRSKIHARDIDHWITTDIRPPWFYKTESDHFFIMTQKKSVIVINIIWISGYFWSIIAVFWSILFININNIISGTKTSMCVNELETVYICNTNWWVLLKTKNTEFHRMLLQNILWTC